VNDRAVGLLEQYDMEVHKTRKGRGAFHCDTSLGCLIFKEYKGNAQKIGAQSSLLTSLRENGSVHVEGIIPDKEGNLTVQDGDGVSYVLKTWYEGRECNIKDRAECLDSVRLLARLHSSMKFASSSDWIKDEALQGEMMLYSPAK
jgi:hypothetical protein